MSKYKPIGKLPYAPMASKDIGVWLVSLSLFGVDEINRKVYRVNVSKNLKPTGIDFRFTDQEEAELEYEGQIADHRTKAAAVHYLVTGQASKSRKGEYSLMLMKGLSSLTN
jgi:hypothetical protein